MITIRVDRDVCQGYGNCVLADPEIFDVDDDGLVVLSQATVAGERLPAVRRAEYDCPSKAIHFTE
ncbi:MULTISPECIES: ferredoxin [unclassified Frankia]|uniref:ferredoxin n=1 Tax=unclassified Frankia TaxID=2632575 RepID=UPI0020250DDF